MYGREREKEIQRVTQRENNCRRETCLNMFPSNHSQLLAKVNVMDDFLKEPVNPEPLFLLSTWSFVIKVGVGQNHGDNSPLFPKTLSPKHIFLNYIVFEFHLKQ